MNNAVQVRLRAVVFYRVADVVGQSRCIGHAKVVVHLGFAQIAINKQHPLVCLGNGDGQVDGGRRFALGRGAGGYHNGFASLFQDGEHNVGTNALVSLLNPELLRRIHVGVGDQGAGKGIVRFFSHLISPLSLCFSWRQHCACRL